MEKIGNTSTVPLDNFYWRDTIPTDAVRIEKIYTGTWSEHLHYEVLYKTNKKGWRSLDKQYSNAADLLDCSREALRLGADEVITEIKFEFGTMQAGFHQVEAPYILCQVNGPRLGRYYTAAMVMYLMAAVCAVPAYAATDIFAVARSIIIDVYNGIAGISTVLAGLMSAVAVIGAKMSSN